MANQRGGWLFRQQPHGGPRAENHRLFTKRMALVSSRLLLLSQWHNRVETLGFYYKITTCVLGLGLDFLPAVEDKEFGYGDLVCTLQ